MLFVAVNCINTRRGNVFQSCSQTKQAGHVVVPGLIAGRKACRLSSLFAGGTGSPLAETLQMLFGTRSQAQNASAKRSQ